MKHLIKMLQNNTSDSIQNSENTSIPTNNTILEVIIFMSQNLIFHIFVILFFLAQIL